MLFVNYNFYSRDILYITWEILKSRRPSFRLPARFCSNFRTTKLIFIKFDIWDSTKNYEKI